MNLRIRLALTALFAVLAAPFARWIPDDAWISFRYAANLASGQGLVYNPGEHVEGMSNLLWTLFLAIPGVAEIPVEQAAVAASAVCALATLWAGLSLLRELAPEAPGRLLAAFGVMMAASMPSAFYATSGMETAAVSLCLTLAAWFHARATRTNPHLHAAGTACAAVVTFLRPEGLIFLLADAIWAIRSRRRDARLAIVFAIAGGLFVALIAFRMLYYGSPVPNPYWAKPPIQWHYIDPIGRAIHYLPRFALISGLALVAPLWFVGIRSDARAARSASVRYAFAQFAFLVLAGGDVLRFDRFVVPVYPLLIAIAVPGAASIVLRPRRFARFGTAGAWIIAALIVGLTVARERRTLAKPCYHDWMQSAPHARLGDAIGAALGPESVVAFNEAGALAYRSGLRVIDMLGLTDPVPAQIIRTSYIADGTSNTDTCGVRIARYVLSRNPDCVIIPAFRPVPPRTESGRSAFHAIWRAFYFSPRIRNDYTLRGVVRFNPDKYLHVFVRNGVVFDSTAFGAARFTGCAERFELPGSRH